MRIFFFAVLCLMGAPAAAAGFGASSRGSTAAQFLELGAGARAIAMGEAHSAVADDATALYWNPAALTRIERRSVAVMHAPYLNTSYFDYAAYGQRLGKRAAFGASVRYFSAGRIAQTDEAGNDAGGLSPYDLALSLGFAYELTGALDGYSAGVGAKLIQSRIVGTARTGAVDAGLLSPALLDGRLRLGLTMSNLGGTLRYDREAQPLPFGAKLGGAYRAAENLLLSADLGVPGNDRPFAALGAEYRVRAAGAWSFAGRAGFNSRTIGSVDGFTGASVGAGIGFGLCAMDYAFLPLGATGQAHRLSLSYSF
ncbi:MAG: PorV/PorQ family protein [Elusimicrobia bacterium]|nr:PorV/PorQ family protein [Elusimicrobiota bacterium]